MSVPASSFKEFDGRDGGTSSVAPELICVPEGSFAMGCESGQDNEKPVHRVWIDEFFIAKLQVTNADYARFLAHAGGSRTPPPFWTDVHLSHPQQPVVGVSWQDAVRYCEWLTSETNERGSVKYRLPTEAEWERAARGGLEGKLYPWGDDEPQSLPNYSRRCSENWKTGPEPVGLAEPNGFGLYNMCDNVHEWCSDWFGADYYSMSPDRNPRGPERGQRRSSRGGSWRHHIKISRCAARSSIPPEFKYADYGFRVACDRVLV